jgi:mRNA interferase RelE/StbE
MLTNEVRLNGTALYCPVYRRSHAADPLGMPNVKRLVEFYAAYRLRVGNYRVLFDRDDIIQVIDVVDVLPRGSAYRRK